MQALQRRASVSPVCQLQLLVLRRVYLLCLSNPANSDLRKPPRRCAAGSASRDERANVRRRDVGGRFSEPASGRATRANQLRRMFVYSAGSPPTLRGRREDAASRLIRSVHRRLDLRPAQNGSADKLRAASHTNGDAARQLPRLTLAWRERTATDVTPSQNAGAGASAPAQRIGGSTASTASSAPRLFAVPFQPSELGSSKTTETLRCWQRQPRRARQRTPRRCWRSL